MMKDKHTAYKYLNRDSVLHVDMLEALHHGEADILLANGSGVLLRHNYRGLLLLSASDVQTAQKCLSSIPRAEVVVARQDFCLPLAREILGLDYIVPCIQHAYLKSDPLPLPEIDALVKPLTPKDLTFVTEHYSLHLDSQYILERLQSRAIYGIYYQQFLAGFAGFHAEGAMGMLEILPAWRRLGLGFQLQVFMTNMALKKGRIPYTQVKIENKASLRMQQKSGFTAAEQPLYWLLRSED